MATQFSGGAYVNTTFTANVRSDFQVNIAAQLINAGWTAVAQAAGQGPGNTSAVTISIGSPGIVTWGSGNHGFLGGEQVVLQISAGGTMPTGLAVNTLYYVKYINATTFNLASSLGGANINTTGSTSGTITCNAASYLMQSATQANVTNPIRVRLKDNRGSCIQVSIENQAGTVQGGNSTAAGGNLLPSTGRIFHIIATQYHFLCFSSITTVAREFVMAGMLYVPSFLTGVTDHGYMFCNSISDSSGLTGSMRTVANVYSSNTPSAQLLWNANMCEQANSQSIYSGMPLCLLTMAWNASYSDYRWANDDILTSDVLLAANLSTPSSGEGKIKGQFFDMVYIADAFAGDSTDTFNSHTWYNITDNNTGIPRGGMWVATS